MMESRIVMVLKYNPFENLTIFYSLFFMVIKIQDKKGLQ
jgi:hypothetical protein